MGARIAQLYTALSLYSAVSFTPLFCDSPHCTLCKWCFSKLLSRMQLLLWSAVGQSLGPTSLYFLAVSWLGLLPTRSFCFCPPRVFICCPPCQEAGLWLRFCSSSRVCALHKTIYFAPQLLR